MTSLGGIIAIAVLSHALALLGTFLYSGRRLRLLRILVFAPLPPAVVVSVVIPAVYKSARASAAADGLHCGLLVLMEYALVLVFAFIQLPVYGALSVFLEWFLSRSAPVATGRGEA